MMGSQLHASASSFEPKALQKEKPQERKEEDDVFVVGLIGNSFQEVSQLLANLSGIAISLEDAAPLIPGSQQQQQPHDRTAHAVHDKWTRTQYFLVAPPQSQSSSSTDGSNPPPPPPAAASSSPSGGGRGGGGPVEAALAAAEVEIRLHLSQLLAFLSCHAVVWVPPGGAVAPQLLGRLRSLQTCKQTLAPALGLSADKKGGGSSSAAGGRGGGGQRGRGRGRGSGGRDSGRGAGAAQQQEPEPVSVAAKDSAHAGPWSLGAFPPPLFLALPEEHSAQGQQAWHLIKKARLLPYDSGSPSALFSLASSAAFALEDFPGHKGGPRGAPKALPPPPLPLHQADDPLLGAAEEAARLLLLLGDDQAATAEPRGHLSPLSEEPKEDPRLRELRELLLGPSRGAFPPSQAAAPSSSAAAAAAAFPPAPRPPAPVWLSAAAGAAAAMEAAATGCRKALLGPSAAPSEKKFTQKKAAVQQSLSQRLPEAVSLLAACVAPELRFSAQSCFAAEELGKEAYLKGLPERYPAAVHTERLSGAIKAYNARAAGLLAPQQRSRLEAGCLALWKAGRQLCGAMSLSGRPCLLPPHPHARAHDSGQEWVRASAGGTLQLVLPDEFDLASANRLIEEPSDDQGAAARDTTPIGGAITVVAGKIPGAASRLMGGGGSGSSLGPLTQPCSSGWVLVGLGGGAEAERHSSCTQPGFADEAMQLHVLELQLENSRAEPSKQKSKKQEKQEQWPSLGGNRGPSRKQQEQQQKQEEEAARRLAEEEEGSLRRQLQELWPSAGRKQQQQQQRGGGDPQHLPAANGSRGPGGKKGQNHRGKQQQTTDGSKGAASQQGKQKQQKDHQEPPQLQSCSLHLGWEYECGRGCRFLLTPDLLPVPPGPDPQRRNNNTTRGRQQQQQRGVEGKHAAALLMTRHLPVFLECPHCAADVSDEDDDEYSSEDDDEYDDGPRGRSSGGRGRSSRSRQTRQKDNEEEGGKGGRPPSLAQLSRFFCLTPDEPLRLASRPLVHFSGPMPQPLPAPTRPAAGSSSSGIPTPGAVPPTTRPQQHQSPPADEGFPAPGELSCLSFSPSEAVRLPPASFVALRFPTAYGLGAPGTAASRRSDQKQHDGESPSGERPLIQVSPRQPFAAWLEAGSVLFPA